MTNVLNKAKNILSWIKNHPTKSILILFLFCAGFSFYTFSLPKWIDNQETVIIGQTVFSPGSQAGMRIAVLNHKSQEPVKKADVEVILEDGKDKKSRTVLFSGKTDETGTADISFAVPENYSGEKNVIIKTKSETGKDELKKEVKIEKSAKIMLSADKPIYQPGQTIHIRSLIFDANTLKSVKNEKAIIAVEDSKGNRIFKKMIETNDYGIVSADFVLGSEINLGPYKITAEAGNYKAEKTVEVKKYVLPKFKIDLATDKEYYLPKQKLSGNISAQYFFGKPVENSKVVIKGYTYENELKEFRSFEGETDDEGNLSFEFVLPDYFVGLPLNKGRE